MKVAFELKGLTALLPHNDDVTASDRLEAWRKAPENKGISRAGDDRSPSWTWHEYLYDDGENVSIPSQNLMTCLRSAGSQMILKKQKTFKEISQAGMGVFAEYLDFRVGDSKASIPIASVRELRDLTFEEQADAVRDLGFRLFVKRARIGTSKHVRVRARFDNWHASGEIIVRASAQELTFERVSKLFELAGQVGLCDWRPGCKTPGPFGMFKSTVKQTD